MGMLIRETVLRLAVIGCIVAGVAGTKEDGLPRPDYFEDAPTTTYGPLPTITSETTGAVVDCEWYGFANTLISAANGLLCLGYVRTALLNASRQNPPVKLEPYEYYTLKSLHDSATNQTLCYNGCFKLGASAGAPPTSTPTAPPPREFTPVSPPDAAAPPPDAAVPPPDAAVPPPVASTPPPPPVTVPKSPPPPTTPRSPPPPTTPRSPPPPPTPRSPPPADDASPPGTNATAVPPPPSRFFLGSGSRFPQPAGLLSSFLAGAALVLSFILAAH